MYKIAEFRKNLKEAFERANKGETIIIVRFGHKYELRKQ